MTTGVDAPLSAEQIKMIRKADCIVFRYSHGRNMFEASKRNPDTLRDEWSIEVECEHRFTTYDKENASEFTRGFYMISSAQYTPEWTTIAGLLRKGDIVSLEWCADAARNQYVKAADLHVDTVNFVINRGVKNPLVFAIGASVTEQNSARMINGA